MIFFFNDTATTEIYTLSLHDALPISESLAGSEICFMDIDQQRLEMIHKLASRFAGELGADLRFARTTDREVRSEEHTSELQSRQYLVCRLLLEKKKNHILQPF